MEIIITDSYKLPVVGVGAKPGSTTTRLRKKGKFVAVATFCNGFEATGTKCLCYSLLCVHWKEL